MNRLVIPSILTAAVLIAGMFAFMPIDKASTVHTTLLSKIGATGQVSYLAGVSLTQIDAGTANVVDPGEFLLLSDTTPTQTNVHVALVVPCDGLAGDLDPEYTVIAGIAPTLNPIISSADVVTALSTAGSADDTYDGICTYHVTTTSGAITDIALIQATGLAGNGNGVGEADDTLLGDNTSITIYRIP